MSRSARILSGSNPTFAAAEPPEAVNMESDFVIILAALLCALICVVGLIAVARCAWLRRGGSNTNRTVQPPANRGLKKKYLESLPKFTYTTTITGTNTTTTTTSPKFGSTECAICLGEFAEGDEIRVLPRCGHGFHVGCIDTWLGSHSSCPSCRQILVVARCHKCGQFPTISSSSTVESMTTTTEAELKAREDSTNNANGNNVHQGHIGGFLP